MAEYIEKKHLMEFLDGCIEEEKGNRSQVIVEAIKMTIDRMPLADLVERKHGEWISPADLICYKCTACGNYANQGYGLDEPIFWDFCPNCGADMRENKSKDV